MAVVSHLKKEDVSIAFLQETHLEDMDNAKLQSSWVGQIFATSYSSFSRGVAILISKNLAFMSLECVKDNQGRYVIVKGVLAGKELTFMNIYCPPAYSPYFLSKTFAMFINHASGDSFLGGDFNCHLNPSLDKCLFDTSPPSKQAKVLSNFCSDIDYLDAWRQLHPMDSGFTFFSAQHKIYTKIDYIFISLFKNASGFIMLFR